MTRKPQARKPKAPPQSELINNTGMTVVSHPVFGQPQPTADPTKFEIKHPSDDPAYKRIDELNREHKLTPLPFPAPRDLPEPRLTLAAVLGENEASVQRRIAANGQVVFHATGDTGSTRGPESQNLVADKMVSDFSDDDKEKPFFFFHLGMSSTVSAKHNTTTTNFTNPAATTLRRLWLSPGTTMEWSRRARMRPRWPHSWKISAQLNLN